MASRRRKTRTGARWNGDEGRTVSSLANSIRRIAGGTAPAGTTTGWNGGRTPAQRYRALADRQGAIRGRGAPDAGAPSTTPAPDATPRRWRTDRARPGSPRGGRDRRPGGRSPRPGAQGCRDEPSG